MMRLQGVDISAVYNNYIKGIYSKCKLEGYEEDDKNITVKLVEANGTSYMNKRYEFTDTTNTKQVIVTTNHDNFVNDSSSTKKKQILICRYCRNDEFHHPPIGRPLMIESDPRNPRKLTITTEGNFCRLECVLQYVQHLNSGGPKLRNINLVDSETIVHIMYDLLYPQETESLRPSMDFWLWDKNGGPLTTEEFFNDSHYYYQLPQIIIRQAKTEYIRTVNH